MAEEQGHISTKNELVAQIYVNVKSNIIQITDDKLKVILLENKETITRSNEWITPFSLLISLILTFCTADFHLAFNIKPEVWQALYLLLIFASIIWLIISLFRLRKKKSIDELINEIRNMKGISMDLLAHNVATFATSEESIAETKKFEDRAKKEDI